MSTVIIDEAMRVPDSVVDLESFREWVYSEDFPEHGKVAFIQGEVWVEMNAERLQSHVGLKTNLHAVLSRLIDGLDLGLFYGDGALWTNSAADISNIPDGLFIAWDSLDTGRVRIVGRPDEAVEVEGSPDLVLEVVSRSSVRKDTLTMPEACFAAGVREYWLVDARSGDIDFRILRRGARGYRAAPDKAGWKRSAVLGREFRLVSRPARHGLTRYELQVREIE